MLNLIASHDDLADRLLYESVDAFTEMMNPQITRVLGSDDGGRIETSPGRSSRTPDRSTAPELEPTEPESVESESIDPESVELDPTESESIESESIDPEPDAPEKPHAVGDTVTYGEHEGTVLNINWDAENSEWDVEIETADGERAGFLISADPVDDDASESEHVPAPTMKMSGTFGQFRNRRQGRVAARSTHAERPPQPSESPPAGFVWNWSSSLNAWRLAPVSYDTGYSPSNPAPRPSEDPPPGQMWVINSSGRYWYTVAIPGWTPPVVTPPVVTPPVVTPPVVTPPVVTPPVVTPPVVTPPVTTPVVRPSPPSTDPPSGFVWNWSTSLNTWRLAPSNYDTEYSSDNPAPRPSAAPPAGQMWVINSSGRYWYTVSVPPTTTPPETTPPETTPPADGDDEATPPAVRPSPPSTDPPSGFVWNWSTSLNTWRLAPSNYDTEYSSDNPAPRPSAAPPAGQMWVINSSGRYWYTVSVPEGEEGYRPPPPSTDPPSGFVWNWSTSLNTWRLAPSTYDTGYSPDNPAPRPSAAPPAGQEWVLSDSGKYWYSISIPEEEDAYVTLDRIIQIIESSDDDQTGTILQDAVDDAVESHNVELLELLAEHYEHVVHDFYIGPDDVYRGSLGDYLKRYVLTQQYHAAWNADQLAIANALRTLHDPLSTVRERTIAAAFLASASEKYRDKGLNFDHDNDPNTDQVDVGQHLSDIVVRRTTLDAVSDIVADDNDGGNDALQAIANSPEAAKHTVVVTVKDENGEDVQQEITIAEYITKYVIPGKDKGLSKEEIEAMIIGRTYGSMAIPDTQAELDRARANQKTLRDLLKQDGSRPPTNPEYAAWLERQGTPQYFDADGNPVSAPADPDDLQAQLDDGTLQVNSNWVDPGERPSQYLDTQGNPIPRTYEQILERFLANRNLLEQASDAYETESEAFRADMDAYGAAVDAWNANPSGAAGLAELREWRSRLEERSRLLNDAAESINGRAEAHRANYGHINEIQGERRIATNAGLGDINDVLNGKPSEDPPAGQEWVYSNSGYWYTVPTGPSEPPTEGGIRPPEPEATPPSGFVWNWSSSLNTWRLAPEDYNAEQGPVSIPELLALADDPSMADRTITVYVTNEVGERIQSTNADGNPITNSNGDPVYETETITMVEYIQGVVIPQQQRRVATKLVGGEISDITAEVDDDDIDALQSIIDDPARANLPITVYVTDESGERISSVDADGEPILDNNGDPVYKIETITMAEYIRDHVIAGIHRRELTQTTLNEINDITGTIDLNDPAAIQAILDDPARANISITVRGEDGKQTSTTIGDYLRDVVLPSMADRMVRLEGEAAFDDQYGGADLPDVMQNVFDAMSGRVRRGRRSWNQDVDPRRVERAWNQLPYELRQHREAFEIAGAARSRIRSGSMNQFALVLQYRMEGGEELTKEEVIEFAREYARVISQTSGDASHYTTAGYNRETGQWHLNYVEDESSDHDDGQGGGGGGGGGGRNYNVADDGTVSYTENGHTYTVRDDDLANDVRAAANSGDASTLTGGQSQVTVSDSTGNIVANNAGLTTVEHETLATSLNLPPTATIAEITDAQTTRNADVAESLGLPRDASYNEIKSESDARNVEFVNSLLGEGSVPPGQAPTEAQMVQAEGVRQQRAQLDADLTSLGRGVDPNAVTQNQQQYRQQILDAADTYGVVTFTSRQGVDTDKSFAQIEQEVQAIHADERREYQEQILAAADTYGVVTFTSRQGVDTSKPFTQIEQEVQVAAENERREYQEQILAAADTYGVVTFTSRQGVDTSKPFTQIEQEVQAIHADEQQQYQEQILAAADAYGIDTSTGDWETGGSKPFTQIEQEVQVAAENEQQRYREQIYSQAESIGLDLMETDFETLESQVHGTARLRQQQFVMEILGEEPNGPNGAPSERQIREAMQVADTEYFNAVSAIDDPLWQQGNAIQQSHRELDDVLREVGVDRDFFSKHVVESAIGPIQGEPTDDQIKRTLHVLGQKEFPDLVTEGTFFGGVNIYTKDEYNAKKGAGVAFKNYAFSIGELIGVPHILSAFGKDSGLAGTVDSMGRIDPLRATLNDPYFAALPADTQRDLLTRAANPWRNPISRSIIIAAATVPASVVTGGVLPNLAIGLAGAGADLSGTYLDKGKLGGWDYAKALAWEAIPFVPGAVRGVTRGVTKAGDAVQAARGARRSDISYFYGDQSLPFKWRAQVPPMPKLFRKPSFSIIQDIEAGSGRVSPVSAVKIPAEDVGHLIQPRSNKYLEDVRPESVPGPELDHYYKDTLRDPDEFPVMSMPDSTRQVMDVVAADFVNTGKPGVHAFPTVDDAGNTKILEFDFRPSPAAIEIGERTGKGTLFHASAQARAVVGSPTTPLSMLGELGSQHTITPSTTKVRMTARSGEIYEVDLPIKMQDGREMAGQEQMGFGSAGFAVQPYVYGSAAAGSPSGGLPPGAGVVEVPPGGGTFMASASRPTELRAEWEMPDPIGGGGWRAEREIPASEVAEIEARAATLFPNDSAAAGRVAAKELQMRRFGQRGDPTYLTDSVRGHEGDFRPSASAQIYDPDTGTILMVQGSYGKGRKGKWQGAGGLVDGNETPQKAALREAFEETGVKGDVVAKIGEDNYVNHHVFAVKYKSGNAAVQDHETLAVRWVPYDEVKNLDLAFPKEELESLRRLRRFVQTGEQPILPKTRPSPVVTATPTGQQQTNLFSDILPHSVPEAKEIPIGIGTRHRTGGGVLKGNTMSITAYETAAKKSTPAEVRRTNMRALRNFLRDPYGRQRVPEPLSKKHSKEEWAKFTDAEKKAINKERREQQKEQWRQSASSSIRTKQWDPAEYAQAIASGKISAPTRAHGINPVGKGSLQDFIDAAQRGDAPDVASTRRYAPASAVGDASKRNADIDGDGIPNRADPDMDGDGIPNRADPGHGW